MRQVGYLQELNRDARSTKHLILHYQNFIRISLFYEKKNICLLQDNPATKRQNLANAAVIIIIIAPLAISVLHNAFNSVKIIQNIRADTSVEEQE